MLVREACLSRAKKVDNFHACWAENDNQSGRGGSMSWRDAAVAALILTAAHIFIAFLTLYDLTRILGDPAFFAFDLFKFTGASFFGTFITITGLSRYKNRQ